MGVARFSSKEVRNLGRAVGVESINHVLQDAVRIRHAAMLTQVLQPRFYEEGL